MNFVEELGLDANSWALSSHEEPNLEVQKSEVVIKVAGKRKLLDLETRS